MSCIDVFNGDADGICALHQLRLAEPVASELVTGVKRDIQLLDRVNAASGDRVTVLDISLDSNRAGLLRLLAAGAQVSYFDHHYAGEIPVDAGLAAHIDMAPDVCTSLLVDRHLGGRFRPWAIVASFGDGLNYALLSANSVGGYAVSVRLPLTRPSGADELCRAVATGGGRKAAAGINALPEAEVDRFVAACGRAFGKNGND